MAKRIIAVAGATGAQGGGLVRAILAGGSDFSVRALTRHASGEKADKLRALGADVVEADIDDLSSLKKAYRGVYGAFCVTPFWEHMSAEREIAQARAMAQAAAAEGVQHVIWSTLEDTRKLVPLTDNRMPTLQDKYKVPHFDGKGEANLEFTAARVPTTMLLTSFFWDNMTGMMALQKKPDGKLSLALPMADKKLPGIAVEDIGKCALGVFNAGAKFIGATVGIAGDHLTGQQMAQALSRALEREVVYDYVPPQVYRTFGFPGADDLANMFQYKRDFEREFCGARSLEQSRKLNPELQNFAQWLSRNKSRVAVV